MEKCYPYANILDYVPEEARLHIPSGQQKIITAALSRMKSEQKLADYLNVSRGTVNDWKHGRTRITFGPYKKLKSMLNEKMPDYIAVQTHKRKSIKTPAIEISPLLAWVFGLRKGDRDEDEYSVGIGTSDLEIAQTFINAIKHIMRVQPGEFWCMVTAPKDFISPQEKTRIKNIYSRLLDLSPHTIRACSRGRNERHKKYHIIIRYYNRLARILLDNIEQEFNFHLLQYNTAVQAYYLKGLIDSEGTVRDSGKIDIVMRPNDSLELCSKIAKNLKLRYRFVRDEKHNLIILTLYGPASLLVAHCNPVHKMKSEKLRGSIQYLRYRARVPQQR